MKFINELVVAGVLTEREGGLLERATSQLLPYLGEYDKDFEAGFSDIVLADIATDAKKDRGALSSLIQKDFLSIEEDSDNLQLIQFTVKTVELIEKEEEVCKNAH